MTILLLLYLMHHSISPLKTQRSSVRHELMHDIIRAELRADTPKKRLWIASSILRSATRLKLRTIMNRQLLENTYDALVMAMDVLTNHSLFLTKEEAEDFMIYELRIIAIKDRITARIHELTIRSEIRLDQEMLIRQSA